MLLLVSTLVSLLACSGDGSKAPADPTTPAPTTSPQPTTTPTPLPQPTTSTPPEPVSLRVATYNVSLYGVRSGQIADQLTDPSDPHAQGIAAVLQTVRPDVVLLNEVDVDDGTTAQRLHDQFLAVAQDGREPLDYPYVYVAPSNTGLHSGLDLDNNGRVDGSREGSDDYAGDCFGYGTYGGQYGFLVFSRYPLGTPRTFQEFLWKDLPDADLPPGWFEPEELDIVRLSSKNHVDLPIDLGNGQTLHFLISHPTPPSFDGEEDRNGRRNHDEIRFWADYISGELGSYHIDDAGVGGSLAADQPFVIAGDLNADPNDGGSREGSMAQLLEHPRVQASPAPTSDGGAEQADLQGGINRTHGTDPAEDTADFEDTSVGNLRIDYVLPSTDVALHDAGVFWPLADDPDFDLVGTFPFPVSDHRPVWVDIEVSP